MNETNELFRAYVGLRQDRHQQWNREHTAIIRASRIPHRIVNGGETILFRERAKPTVDFYPSTGRWRTVGKHSRTFRGGARAFLGWYAKQTKEADRG